MTTAVIEALATGLSIIATWHSGFPDQVILGKNGYLAQENDPEDFAAKMLEFMEHPEKWPAMSKFARAHALATYDRKALIKKNIAIYRRLVPGVKKVVFVTGMFPAVSEAWFINQVADLIEQGIDVRIYAFARGSEENVSQRYVDHKMGERTVYLDYPEGIFPRLLAAIPKFFSVLFRHPTALLALFNVAKYGANSYSLKLLFWTEPFIGCDAPLIHCHFGTVANRFLIIRDALKLTQPFLTSFYGYDVSHIVKEKGKEYYARLTRECPYFLTMSNNMKERIVAIGFPPDKIEPLPISEDVESFPYKERTLRDGEVLRVVTVGRFVEKKGFDDLIRATAIVKKRFHRPFHVHIIGGGMLEKELRALAKDLEVEDVITFEGLMKVQDITKFYMTAHLYVQPSKTSRDGDME